MRKDEEERKEKLLRAEKDRREWKGRRQWMRANGIPCPYDPTIDDEAEMQKQVAVEELRRERDKLVALQARITKDLERQEQFRQEVEEEALAEEAERAKEEEKLAGEAEATGAAAEGEPAGGAQSSPLPTGGPKARAKGAGKTGSGPGPGTTVKAATGEANQGKSSQIKATKGKLRMPKAAPMSKAVAKAVRDAKILMGTLKEGE
jgi:hypothetical protein